MSDQPIPIYRPSLSGNEARYVMDCLKSGWISSLGKYVAAFESAFALAIGAPFATSVCNGTVALHLALLGLGIGPGDEVLVPTFTYVASVNAIRYVGAEPVFVDSLSDTWQMDPDQAEAKITSKTRAIMCVHLYGQSCDMDRFVEVKDRHGLYLVEDCAEAFGTWWRDRHAGCFGDVATFSFFGNKTITTGEGGMVVTASPELLSRMKKLKGQGVSEAREYWHDVIGYNYRMTNVAAAIGLAQLERAEELVEKKRGLAERYRCAFGDTPLRFHSEAAPGRHSYWMCSVLAKSKAERDLLRGHLKANGIETRPTFPPVHSMPMYNREEQYYIADALGGQGMNLPSYPDLSDSDFNRIADAIHAFYAKM